MTDDSNSQVWKKQGVDGDDDLCLSMNVTCHKNEFEKSFLVSINAREEVVFGMLVEGNE